MRSLDVTEQAWGLYTGQCVHVWLGLDRVQYGALRLCTGELRQVEPGERREQLTLSYWADHRETAGLEQEEKDVSRFIWTVNRSGQ